MSDQAPTVDEPATEPASESARPDASAASQPKRSPDHSERRIKLFGRVLIAVAIVASGLLVWRLAVGDSAVVRNARVIEERAREKHRPKKAQEVSAACRNPECQCALGALAVGLDLDLTAESLALLESAQKTCPNERALLGMRAEALVRASRPEGLDAAQQVLARDPENAHAQYAVALASFRAGQFTEAVDAIQRALYRGRGSAANLLAGLIAYSMNRLEEADAHFRQMLTDDPNDPSAIYNLGVVAHHQGRFAAAREAYVKVTRLDPSNADVRYNLAVLAHALGSEDEAQHNLEKFRALRPSDEAVQKLKNILATPVPRPRRGVQPGAGSPQ